MPILLLVMLFLADKPAEVVAIVDGAPIGRALLEERARAALAQVRQREYEVRRQVLEAIVAEQLLDKEAARRKVSMDALVEAEVNGKARAPSPQEIDAQYASLKSRLGGKSEAEGKQLAEQSLTQQRRGERRSAFLKELRGKAGVRILLDPPRWPATVGDAPTNGPADAPVTIVEFSDFECPYCARAAPTIKKILETYGAKVRLAFRDFPLPIHPKAPKASEAAACAGEQHRFWEMHDRLFAPGSKLEVADLKAHAVALGLEAAAFDTCLDSGRQAATVRAGLQAGQALGVGGTPAFFINGRFLSGAQPFESFAEVIDEELERARAPAR